MRQTEHAEPSVGLCSICGDRADGYHYGVLSCRGCNAFFRRAVAFNLQFHCRRDGRCEINKNARCACRACRLQKCRDVGMDQAAVQVRREVKDVLGLNASDNHRHINVFGFGPSSSSLSSPDSSISSVISAPVFGSARILDSPRLKSRLLGSMTSLVAHSPRLVHPIDRLVEWYFCQRYRRCAMLCQTVEQILSTMGPGQNGGLDGGDGGHTTPEGWSQVNKVQMVLMMEWAEQSEEFYQQLESPLDKTRLLRAFGPKYLLLDTIMHGLEMGYADRIVLPNGTSMCRNDHRRFLRQLSPPFGSSQEEIDRIRATEMMYSEEMLSAIEELIQPMADMEVTFGEFIALRLLLFWDPELAENVPATSARDEIIKKASERALTDLMGWYELHSMADRNDGQRMENLLRFLPVIKKFAAYLAEMTALLPDFGVMPEWQFIADLVLGPNFDRGVENGRGGTR